MFRIYVFHDVLCDYTPGVAVAQATSRESAIDELLQVFDFAKTKEALDEQQRNAMSRVDRHSDEDEDKRLAIHTAFEHKRSLFKLEVAQKMSQGIPKSDFGMCYCCTREEFRVQLEKARCVELASNQAIAFFQGGGS